jgi:carbon storage regulator
MTYAGNATGGAYMLVFTRHIGETIIVDQEIVVTILGFEDGQVRLGITAPPEVVVLRKELLIAEEGVKVQ